ncbi:MAG: tripartite tricarboxylate transporter permease [Acetivibrionales bacterium]|jgi:putative tricarboxylic transport membrane protein
MGIWEGLAYGLNVIIDDPLILVLLFLGSMAGTIVGALPGLGAVSGCALLLPIAYTLGSPEKGLLLLSTIYLGNMFGGRITAILINVPGDAPAVVTAIEGYPMYKQGRGGLAMGITAISSFIGGFVSFILLAGFAPPLARLALNFGPAELLMVIVFGFAAIIGIEEEQPLRSLIMLCFGVLITNIGIDLVSGVARYTFTFELFDGIPFALIAIGVFGLSEMFKTAEEIHSYAKIEGTKDFSVRKMWPTWKEFKSCIGAITRGTFLGSYIGFLPGAGGTVATFLEYSLEKGISKHPEEFGKGNLQAIAGCEAADNSSIGGAMIPLFALGIPGSSSAAIIMGAMIMFGIKPGPRVFITSGNIVWTVIVGLFVSNIMLLLANIFLIPLFIKLIDVGQKYLKQIVCTIIMVGAYAITYSNFFLIVCLFFGIFGYFMSKLKYPVAPFMLTLVLFQSCEEAFRQALLISRGNYSIFWQSGISKVLIIMSLAALIVPPIRRRLKRKKAAAA